MTLYLEHYGVTDAGKVRQNNEDSLLMGDGRDPTLFAIADGVGGFEAGEVASSIAVDALRELEPEESFEAAIREANRRIMAAARGDEKFSGMGTTVVALRIIGSRREPSAEIAHVGDSRAYLLRGGEFRPITEDHSLVAELVRSGDLTRAQAAEHPQKNLITRALGAGDEVEVDTITLPVEDGDRILLCSDGLSDMVPEDRISRILTGYDSSEEAARRLLSAALDAGGSDNITVIVADVKRYEAPERPAERSGDTSEMEALDASEESSSNRSRRGQKKRARGSSKGFTTGSARKPATRRRRIRQLKRALAWIVRTIAALVVVAILLTPAYLWANSRYFLAYDGSEVVVYRGLPYAVGNVELNREWERTDLQESDLDRPYRDQIRNHKLYTQPEVEEVLRDLRKS